METYHITTGQDNVTGDFRQVHYVRMGDLAGRIMQIWLLAAIVFAMAVLFSLIARGFGNLPADFRVGLPEIGLGFLVFVATMALQEWIHVLVLRRYGARPEFGLFRHNAIAYISIPGYGLRRNTLILSALAPLVLITSLALLGIWLLQGTAWVALFALVAVVNAGAATSDLWMVSILLRYPSSAWAVDDSDGMRILMPL